MKINVHGRDHYIVVTRFDEFTWMENSRYRENKGSSGCIYGTVMTMTSRIPKECPVFVIEMNNTKNRIEGIGLIKNHAYKHRKIYMDDKYNNYVYGSKTRVDRSDLTEDNIGRLQVLEDAVFKGKDHIKRGTGFSIIPRKKQMDIQWKLVPLLMESFNMYVKNKKNPIAILDK